jgi:anti-sigma-K factor RskA
MSQSTDVHTLAGAYALDALTEIERAGFARHVAACPSCAQEVAELTETASRLAATDWVTPPPGLRDAVLAEVARTRQVGRGRTTPGDSALRRWRARTVAAAAAAVVAVAGAGTVWVVQEERVDAARVEAAALRTERQRVAEILAAGDVQVRAATVAGGGTVTVAVSAARDDGVALLTGLPEPPAGQVYQLWLIDAGRATSAGVLAVGQRDGTTLLERVGGADTLGVTVEPPGGSTTPTLPVVAGVTLA